ncbi:MAG: HEPN domain-containing protein [Candidatus Heimdallarchaeota archaeon]|nr:HEPN domain-containing protein [Candidatus Heimdallarchaeota archaeon]
MHKKEVDLLLRRSKNFLEAAKERFNKKDWDLTCFLAEQAVQLYFKAVILEESGQTPRTQSLRQLIAQLGQIIEKRIDYDRNLLFMLENAYFNARYIAVIYEKEQAEEALKTAKELFTLVENIRNR